MDASEGFESLAQDFEVEIVHQITKSVFGGLRSDIQQLSSTSSGHVNATLVAAFVERARAEFQRRVSELFGH